MQVPGFVSVLGMLSVQVLGWFGGVAVTSVCGAVTTRKPHPRRVRLDATASGWTLRGPGPVTGGLPVPPIAMTSIAYDGP